MTTGADWRLEGAHAVVTGGGRGIGAAISVALAKAGARLTIMGRDERVLEAQLERLSSSVGGEHEAVPCDVTDEASVTRAFAAARERFGEVFVLVNNAGAAESKRFVDTTIEEWSRMIAVNLTSAFLCTRAVLPGMLAAKRGRVVNVASTAGVAAASRIAAYSAAKHGVVGLTRSVAAEVAKQGITVNAVCPGYTETEMAQRAIDNLSTGLKKSAQEARALLEATIPRGRLIEPDEVAGTVAWLCSAAASGITGQAIVINGGDP